MLGRFSNFFPSETWTHPPTSMIISAFWIIYFAKHLICYRQLSSTSRVPVEGKSSVCLICMKYRIIFLIIIIISLGQILLSYVANPSGTHARTYAGTHMRVHAHARERVYTHTLPSPLFSLSLFDGSLAPNRDGPLRW